MAKQKKLSKQFIFEGKYTFIASSSFLSRKYEIATGSFGALAMTDEGVACRAFIGI